jgi:hypothetical protein
MTYHHFTTCRFCKETIRTHDPKVKYGTRHYAHHACYLDAGKSLDDLPAHQIAAFPWRLMHDRDLLAYAEARMENETRRQAAWEAKRVAQAQTGDPA